MPNVNIVVLAGNLVRDPELKHTPKGTAICSFDIAINRTWKSESGDKVEEVTFVSCSAFGNTAENIAKFLTKGNPIMLQGRLKLDTWEDKNNGGKRSKLNVICESFQFLSGKGKSEEEEPEYKRKPATISAGKKSEVEEKTENVDEYDVPF